MSIYSVDRIEGDIVILEDRHRKRHSVSLCKFTGAVREGDVVTEQDGRYETDDAATLKRRQSAKEMSDRLFGKNEPEK